MVNSFYLCVNDFADSNVVIMTNPSIVVGSGVNNVSMNAIGGGGTISQKLKMTDSGNVASKRRVETLKSAFRPRRWRTSQQSVDNDAFQKPRKTAKPKVLVNMSNPVKTVNNFEYLTDMDTNESVDSSVNENGSDNVDTNGSGNVNNATVANKPEPLFIKTVGAWRKVIRQVNDAVEEKLPN